MQIAGNFHLATAWRLCIRFQDMEVEVKHQYNGPHFLELQGRKVVEVLQVLVSSLPQAPLLVCSFCTGWVGQIHRNSVDWLLSACLAPVVGAALFLFPVVGVALFLFPVVGVALLLPAAGVALFLLPVAGVALFLLPVAGVALFLLLVSAITLFLLLLVAGVALFLLCIVMFLVITADDDL